MSKSNFKLNFINGKYGIVTQKDKETAALELGWVRSKLSIFFEDDPCFSVREDADNILYVTFNPEPECSDKVIDIIRFELKGVSLWSIAILCISYSEYTPLSGSRIYWRLQNKGLFNFYSYDFESHEMNAIIEKILSDKEYALFVRKIFPKESNVLKENR